METSPSERSDERTAVRMEPDPSPAEAAAIAAAIRAHLAAAGDAGTDETPADWWRTNAWRLQGRFRAIRGTRARPDRDLPRDPWRAGDRLDRS